MLAEMYCGIVTEIYARIGIRYLPMRDYCNLDHAEILARIKELSSARNEKSRLSPALTPPIYSPRNDESASPKGTNPCNSVKLRLLQPTALYVQMREAKTHL